MLKLALITGLGGFAGTVARFLVQHFTNRYFPSIFPYGTLLVNITGCFLIGVFLASIEKGDLMPVAWRLFLTTGLCGGFTTFSAFAFENVTLINQGQYFYASLYIIISVVVGIAATFFGVWATRAFIF